MKSFVLKVAVITLAVVAYIGAPFVTAWSIREAARNGNSAYLARAIDWPSVRETLKPSLYRIAFDLPDAEAKAQKSLSLWRRVKAYWGGGAVNIAIDNYLTPENLPKLFSARKTYRTYVSGDDDAKGPLVERIERFWARVKRAEFTSFTTFEIDLLDKHDPNRMYLGKLKLTTTGWMLKELRIKDLETARKTSPAEPQPLIGATKSAWQPEAKSAEAQSAPLLSVGWTLNFISPAEAAPAHKPGFLQRARAAAR